MRLRKLQGLALGGMIAGISSTPLTGQRPTPTPVAPPKAAVDGSTDTATPPPDPRNQKAMRRLRADLKKLTANLANTPHAFKGSVRTKSAAPEEDLDIEFTGACKGKLQWLQLAEWRIVFRGQREVVSHQEKPWGKPQGDSPEPPLTPHLFAANLPHAKLSLPKPTSYRDRPALRIQASWRGAAATKAAYSASTPSSMHERILEAAGRAAGRPDRDNYLVDACLIYDPATATWLAATFRLAILNGQPAPMEQQWPAPEGLPPRPSNPIVEAIWHLERCDLKELPLPELDARARALLEIDEHNQPNQPPTKENGG